MGWAELRARFMQELKSLQSRYANGAACELATGKRHANENAWCTPWELSTGLSQAFTLHTIAFSHPLNADPSFPEFCTPCVEDAFFGARLDGFAALQSEEEDVLAFVNPEYVQECMDRCFGVIACRASKARPFRCVLVIPYDIEKANRSGVGTGLSLIRNVCGVRVHELFVVPPRAFQFWPDSWNNADIPRRLRGSAPWSVGIILVENSAASSKYPVYVPALLNVHHLLEAMTSRLGGVLQPCWKWTGTLEKSVLFNWRDYYMQWMQQAEMDLLRECMPEHICFRECDIAVRLGILASGTLYGKEKREDYISLRDTYVCLISLRMNNCLKFCKRRLHVVSNFGRIVLDDDNAGHPRGIG